jgi:hypothetical protein
MWLLAVALIQLTGPEEQSILVNPEEIVSVRRPRSSEHFAPGTRCLINTADGKIIAVQELCSSVLRLIEEKR